jgi:hypothetical protein
MRLSRGLRQLAAQLQMLGMTMKRVPEGTAMRALRHVPRLSRRKDRAAAQLRAGGPS